MGSASDTTAGSPPADLDLKSLEDAQGVINALTKLIQGRKIYAKNNPTLAKFSEEFDAAARQFFEEEDALELTIERDTIRWHDQKVYENDRREESLAFLFYKDGIGELVIHRTITRDELDRFIDILKDELHNTGPDSDVVTKLWRADLEHVSYRVLDEYLVGEFGQGQGSGGDERVLPLESCDHPELPTFADKGRVIVQSGEETHPLDAHLRHRAGVSLEQIGSVESEERFQAFMESCFKVSSEELKLCHEEMFHENSQDKLQAFLKEILPFAKLVDNPSVLRDTSNIIECVSDYVIGEQDPTAMGGVLELVRGCKSDGGYGEPFVAVSRKLQSSMTDTPVLLSLAQRVQGWNREAEEVFRYLRAVGDRAVPTICALMGTLTGARLHTEACDVLFDIAGPDVMNIIEELDMDKPHVARDVVYLIRRARPSQSPTIVRELVHYPDARVREDVLDYLADVADSTAIELLTGLIEGPDPQTRIKTLVAISRVKHPAVVAKVEAIAFERKVLKRPREEQEQIFRTLGRVCGEDVLPRLQQFITKKGFWGFGKSGNREGKLLVVRALEAITSEPSLTMLRELANDSDDLVSSKARYVLDRVSKRAQDDASKGGGSHA